MVERRYILERLRDKPGSEFPDIPYWTPADPCAGLFLPGRSKDDLSELVTIREHIEGIWYGVHDSGDGFLIVQFSEKFKLETGANVLPLHIVRDGVLSSYSSLQSEVLSGQTQFHAVELRWKGVERRFAVSELTRLSLSIIWPETTFEIHPGLPFKRETIIDGSETGASNSRSESGRKKPGGKISVKASENPIAGTGKGVFDSTDKRLNEMSEEVTLKNIFRRLFKRNIIGDGQAEGAGAGRGQSNPTPKGPGFFEGMAGWMKWHTPLGNSLARQFGDRIKLVEKLINKGDIDSALKMALKMGKGGTGQSGSRFPLRLPKMRANLNYDFSGGFSMPILGGDIHFDLRQRYAKLAKELEEKDDYRRAAYIYSQLLDDHLEAVNVLERGEMFEEAAKLSLDSGQAPELTIRLYYLAGKKDFALALAKRTGCFDRLAEDSLTKDREFHKFVVKEWTDLLLALDQPVRALEVTDDLVRREKKETDPFLTNARYEWLIRALELEAGQSAGQSLTAYRPQLVARALLNARWDGKDLNPLAMRDFPYAAHPGSGPLADCFLYFQSLAIGEDPETLLNLMSIIDVMSDETHPEQRAFWAGPAPQIIDRLARNIIAHGSDFLTVTDMKAIKKMTRLARLPVLSADLAKVKTLKKAGKGRLDKLTVPDLREKRDNPVVRGCILNNGSFLALYKTGRLELRNAAGKSIWQGQVSDIQDMIPIGTSPSVMLLRKVDTGETRLTRFDTHRRKFTDIGILNLEIWHDTMSDTAWMVQIDNLVGAIDIVALCRKTPLLEMIWSIETTGDLRVVAFLHTSAPSWVTMNLTRVRYGVLQVWTHTTAGDIEMRYLAPEPPKKGEALPARVNFQWTPARNGSWFSINADDNTNFYAFTHANDFNGRQMAHEAAARRRKTGFDGQDVFTVMDMGRMGTRIIQKNGTELVTSGEAGEKSLSVAFEGEPNVWIVARGTGPEVHQQKQLSDVSHICLAADDRGRLFRIDTRKGRIDSY